MSCEAMPEPDGRSPSSQRAYLTEVLRNLRAGARLAAFLRVRSDEFLPTVDSFAMLVMLDLLAGLFLGLASAGLAGQFNYYEVPRALLFVPLSLYLGLILVRLETRPRSLLLVPVALVAAGLVITLVSGILDLLIQYRVLAWGTTYWRYIPYVTTTWWLAVVAAAIIRLTPMPPPRAAVGVLAGFVLLVVPVWLYPQNYLWIPGYDESANDPGRGAYAALAGEKAFYAQPEILERALEALLPGRPGVPDVYLLAAGLYAREDVFMKETRLIETLFRERFDSAGRSLVLINNPVTVHEYPVASLTSITAALKQIGSRMNVEEDVLVFYISSHGSEKHQLSVNFWPLRLQPIEPAALKQALDESGIKWKVIIVSACYSGGFVEPFKDDRTMMMTASSATRQSFGCGNESDSTYLAKALFDEELRKTYSFETAFENARLNITAREQAQNFTPSEPQIFVGARMREKMKGIERRLEAIGAK
jgi:hypothetical protein